MQLHLHIIFIVIISVKTSVTLQIPLFPIVGTNGWNNGIQVQKQDDFSIQTLVPQSTIFAKHHFLGNGGVSFRQDSSTSNGLCKEPTGQFSDPKYCDKYYDCWEGRPVASGQCGHGLMFNEQTSSCDYPENVNCNGKTVAQPLEDKDEGCEQPYGTFANPRHCASFTVCHAGKATYFKCGEGLAYDKELGVCASPQDPACLQHQNDTDTNPPPEGEELPELPLNPDIIKPIPPPGGEGDGVQFPIIPGVPGANKCPTASSGFYPVVKDCKAVVVCINGNGHFLNCPEGSYYHPSEASCKPGKTVYCEQMKLRMLTNAKNSLPVKYAYSIAGYPLLPFGRAVYS